MPELDEGKWTETWNATWHLASGLSGTAEAIRMPFFGISSEENTSSFKTVVITGTPAGNVFAVIPIALHFSSHKDTGSQPPLIAQIYLLLAGCFCHRDRHHPVSAELLIPGP